MVTILDVTYSLIDLDPNDGITPWADLARTISHEDPHFYDDGTDWKFWATGGSQQWSISPMTAIQFELTASAQGFGTFSSAGAWFGADGTEGGQGVTARGVFNESWSLMAGFENRTTLAVETGYVYHYSYGDAYLSPTPEPAQVITLLLGVGMLALWRRWVR